ncbi:MAG: efflux RND transporter periplasmic adaptor subunit [Deltaproteobacteria bacterium]|nr:efflux RND transporter periplasmic adaptor subunit [Deltaproteobacteria bacterium]
MSENETNKKVSFSFLGIVIIVLATLIFFGSAAYFFGYLGPRGVKIAMTEESIKSHEDHDKTTLWTCGMHPFIIVEEPGNCPVCGMKLIPKRDVEDSAEEKGERKIAYWRAPMNPSEIYDKPGKSAMGMDLVPVYENALAGGIEIKIDPVTQQNMGIRTALVRKGPLVHTIRTYGHITYDETRMSQISPKFSGWIEKLYADFTGQQVKKGQPLFSIYSPELLTAQEEYLAAYRNSRRNPGKNAKNMLKSARLRLKYFDVPESEIHSIEAAGIAKKALKIHSPFKGIVTHKNAFEGGFVKAGMTIYKIADLSRVWVEAHIYEYELPMVSLGQEAQMTLPYQPGRIYSGKVAYIYPYLQRKTRDVVIRLEFENPQMELKPDMYADVLIKTEAKNEGIIIPSEAIIRSGERNIVFVPRGGGKFTPREVMLGASLVEGTVEVLKGIAPGESVVTSGQFLLDSESKLKEAVQKMMEAKKGVKKKPVESEDDFFSDMEGDA